jgi:hypothetical protein
VNGKEADNWMMHYYQHPVPDQLVDAIRSLAAAQMLKGQKMRTGFWNRILGRTPRPPMIDAWQRCTDAPLIAFAAKVFEKNPSSIDGWLDALQQLREEQKRSLWIAAWFSGTAGVGSALRRQAQKTSKGAVQFIDELLSQSPRPIDDLPINGPVILDMLWGAFFATGDERYVLRIVAALGAVASPQGTPAFALGSSALWSLTSNAKQHPRVKEVCAALVPQTKEGMRMMLESIVDAGAGKTD